MCALQQLGSNRSNIDSQAVARAERFRSISLLQRWLQAVAHVSRRSNICL